MTDTTPQWCKDAAIALVDEGEFSYADTKLAVEDAAAIIAHHAPKPSASVQERAGQAATAWFEKIEKATGYFGEGQLAEVIAAAFADMVPRSKKMEKPQNVVGLGRGGVMNVKDTPSLGAMERLEAALRNLEKGDK